MPVRRSVAARVCFFLGVMLLAACASPATPGVNPPPSLPAHFPYGVVYPYPPGEWTEDDRLPIRERLETLRSLGANTIVQVFSSRLLGTGREKNWFIFLDEAEAAGMQVIARLYPDDIWDGDQFTFQTVAGFLAVARDHPALLAYLGLHEPFEQYDSEQLRDFYAGMKELAPDLAIAHFMSDMSWFQRNIRFPNRGFSAQICDICLVWHYPTRTNQGQPVFQEALLRRVIRANRRLIDERSPESQLWILGQTFTQVENKKQYRMPTAEEMEDSFVIAAEEKADGFLWYPWLHNVYDEVLSSDGMEAQRQAIGDIYEAYFSPSYPTLPILDADKRGGNADFYRENPQGQSFDHSQRERQFNEAN